MYKYMASPYTAPTPDLMDKRFDEAMRAAAWLLKRNIWVYSPIVHCHQMAIRYSLPKDHVYWKSYDTAMLLSSSGMLILTIEGWDKSSGIRDEQEVAEHYRYQIQHLRPFGLEYEIIG